VEWCFLQLDVGEFQQVVEQAAQPLRVAMDDLQEFLGVLPICEAAIQQGLGIALNGGERRTQFVRDVQDELHAHLFQALELCDVPESQDRALHDPLSVPHGHGSPRQNSPTRVDQRDLGAASTLLMDGHLEKIVHLMASEDLQGSQTQCRISLETEKLLGRRVHQRDVPARVQDQEAIDHALHDCPGALAFLLQALQDAFDVGGHGVQRSGEVSEFIPGRDREVRGIRPRETPRAKPTIM
jgi:hypothetical protein